MGTENCFESIFLLRIDLCRLVIRDLIEKDFCFQEISDQTDGTSTNHFGLNTTDISVRQIAPNR